MNAPTKLIGVIHCQGTQYQSVQFIGNITGCYFKLALKNSVPVVVAWSGNYPAPSELAHARRVWFAVHTKAAVKIKAEAKQMVLFS